MYVRSVTRWIGGRGPKAGVALAAGCLALTAVAACGSSTPSKASDAPKSLTSIKIGYPLPNVQSVAMQIAAKNGIFKQYGIDATAVSLGTANVVNAALTSGSVDYSLTSASQLITSVSQGAGIIAISGYTVGTPVDVIFSNSYIASHHLSTKSSTSQIVKALDGAKVAVSSPVIEVQEATLLKAYKVSPSSVNTVTVSSEGGMASLLKSGQIDAFIAGPPVPQIAQAEGAGKILISSLNAPVWNAGNANLVLAANKAYAAAHPELTKEVVSAVHAAIEFVTGNKVKASKQAAPLLSATQSEVEASLPLAGYSVCAPMSTELWAKTVQFSIASGSLTSTATASEGAVWTNHYVAAQKGC